MSRLEPLDPPFAEDVAAVFGRLMPPGMDPLILFRTVAHNPRVLKRFFRGGLLDEGSISLRTREILILRTCALCASEYEWGVHVAFFGGAAEFTKEQIAATVDPDSDSANCWSYEERDVVALADELHAGAQISGPLWERLAQTWKSDQLVEMVVLCGLYHMVSFVTRAFEVELEPAAARFPGRA